MNENLLSQVISIFFVMNKTHTGPEDHLPVLLDKDPEHVPFTLKDELYQFIFIHLKLIPEICP